MSARILRAGLIILGLACVPAVAALAEKHRWKAIHNANRRRDR